MSGKTAASAAVKVTSFRNNPYWAQQRAEVKRARIYARNLAMAGGAIDYRGRPVRVQQRFPIVKGDIVQVTTTSKKRDYRNGGRPIRNSDGSFVEQDYFGQQGVVLRVKQSTGQIVVQGVNLRQRVAQPTPSRTGHFFKLEAPIPYEHVSLVDPSTGQPVTGLEETGRIRVARGTGTRIPKPYVARAMEREEERRRLKTPPAPPLHNELTDTNQADAHAITYDRPVVMRPHAIKESEGGKYLRAGNQLAMKQETLEARVARIRF